MKNVEWRVENEIQRISVVVFVGGLLLFDQATKYFFSDFVSIYCNSSGPWGVPASNGTLIVVMIAILAVTMYFFWKGNKNLFLCYSREDGNTGFTIASTPLCKATDIRIPAFAGMTIQRFALLFIFAGGFSNLVDRIVFGCVRDFALVSWFPAFNVADVFLTIGASLLLLLTSRLGEKSGVKH